MVRRPKAALLLLLPGLTIALAATPALHAAPSEAEIAVAPELGAPLPTASAATTAPDPVWTWQAGAPGLVEIVLALPAGSAPPAAFELYTAHDNTTALPVTGGRFHAAAGTTYVFAATGNTTSLVLKLRPASPFNAWYHDVPGHLRATAGVPDLHKFAFGIEPSSASPAAHPNYPSPRVRDGFLELAYTLRDGQLSNSTGSVSVTGQLSADGVSWSTITPLQTGPRSFVLRTPVDPDEPTKQLRLAVNSSETLPASASAGIRSEWTSSDPAGAAEWLNSLPGEERNDRAGDVAARWMRQDPEAAARWLEDQDDLRAWTLRAIGDEGRR